MAKSIKRRVRRIGAKHRLWITLEQDTFETLQARGEKLGYSISALAQRVINRGVAAGLIDDASPTTTEEYYLLSDDLYRTMKKLPKLLSASVDLREHMVASLNQVVMRQVEQIAQQDLVIKKYEQDRREAAELTVVVQPNAPDIPRRG